MKRLRIRATHFLPVFFSLVVALTSCAGTSGKRAVTPERPFVTWDPATTIPFLLVRDTPESDEYYLGLWHTGSGNVSLENKPLFSIHGRYRDVYWDGGHGFFIVGGEPWDKLSVSDVDPRVWTEVVSRSGIVDGFEFTSTGKTFTAFFQNDYVLLLTIHDYRNQRHISAGFFPNLPPGGKFAGVAGFRADDGCVHVYCVTSRPGFREADSRRVHEDVHGIVELTYSPGLPARWRMVNPDAGLSCAGGSPLFFLYGDRLVICDSNGTRTVDLVTGMMQPLAAATGESGRVVLDYPQPALPDSGGPALKGGVYGRHLVLPFSYLRPDVGETTHFVAFKDGEVVGRLVQEGSRLLAFRGEVRTFEGWLPHGTCHIRFPTEMQPPQPQGASVEEETFGPDEFEAIWMHADYPDLFNETLRCDGWRSESMAHVLLTRFRENPLGFLTALAGAYPEEIEKVADHLAYGAGYGDLDEFRNNLESLRQELSKVREPAVALPHLEEEYAKSQERGSQEDQIVGAVDCYFKAKYASRVYQQAVDLAFVIDLSSQEGKNLYDYELGLLKHSLDLYGASGPGSGISSYRYHPWYETIDIRGNAAEVAVIPRASGDHILTLNDISMGEETHRLMLVRRPGGWKILSDSYENETVSQYPPGTDFEALLAEQRVQVIDVILDHVEKLESGGP